MAHASSSECSSSSVAARKFAAVAGKVTRAMAASKAIDFLAEARPWDEYVRAAVEAGSDAAARVRACRPSALYVSPFIGLTLTQLSLLTI